MNDDNDEAGPHLPGAPVDKKGRRLLVAVIADPQDSGPAVDPPRYGSVRDRPVAALLVAGQGYVVLAEGGISTFTLLDPT